MLCKLCRLGQKAKCEKFIRLHIPGIIVQICPLALCGTIFIVILIYVCVENIDSAEVEDYAAYETLTILR